MAPERDGPALSTPESSGAPMITWFPADATEYPKSSDAPPPTEGLTI